MLSPIATFLLLLIKCIKLKKNVYFHHWQINKYHTCSVCNDTSDNHKTDNERCAILKHDTKLTNHLLNTIGTLCLSQKLNPFHNQLNPSSLHQTSSIVNPTKLQKNYQLVLLQHCIQYSQITTLINKTKFHKRHHL